MSSDDDDDNFEMRAFNAGSTPMPSIERGRFPKKQTPTVSRKRKANGSTKEDVSFASSNSGARAKRRLAQCVVEGCKINEASKKSNGTNYGLFDPPKDKSGRLRWALYVPEVDCAVHLLRYCKVCELHFIDGKPTTENPLPSENLHPLDKVCIPQPKSAEVATKLLKKQPEIFHNYGSGDSEDEDDNFSDVNEDDDQFSEEEDKDDFKAPPVKIKLPVQKNRKAMPFLPPPKGFKPYTPPVSLSASDKVTAKPTTVHNNVENNSKSDKIVVNKPASAVPINIASILKEAMTATKPSFPTQSIVVNRSSLNSATARVQTAFKPAVPPSNQSKTSPQLPKSVSQFPQKSEDDRPEFEPCQHCGVELVEIRKDLVRVENKIDIVTTLMRSVLQRTMPSVSVRPATATGVVKITPTVVTSVQNAKPPQAVSTPVVAGSDQKTVVTGKPVKLIFNSQGFVTATGATDSQPKDLPRDQNAGLVKSEENKSQIKTVVPPKVKVLKMDVNSQKSGKPESSEPVEDVSEKILEKSKKKGEILETVKMPRKTSTHELPELIVVGSSGSGANRGVAENAKTNSSNGSGVALNEKAGKSSYSDEPVGNTGTENYDESSNTTTEAIARAALLFSGHGVTINHLKEYGPTWLAAVESDKIQNVLDELVDQEMLEVLGERQLSWPAVGSKNLITVEVYRKLSQEEISAESLKSLNLTMRQYVFAYKQKGCSKYTAQLNKFCDEVID